MPEVERGAAAPVPGGHAIAGVKMARIGGWHSAGWRSSHLRTRSRLEGKRVVTLFSHVLIRRLLEVFFCAALNSVGVVSVFLPLVARSLPVQFILSSLHFLSFPLILFNLLVPPLLLPFLALSLFLLVPGIILPPSTTKNLTRRTSARNGNSRRSRRSRRIRRSPTSPYKEE